MQGRSLRYTLSGGEEEDGVLHDARRENRAPQVVPGIVRTASTDSGAPGPQGVSGIRINANQLSDVRQKLRSLPEVGGEE